MQELTLTGATILPDADAAKDGSASAAAASASLATGSSGNYGHDHGHDHGHSSCNANHSTSTDPNFNTQKNNSQSLPGTNHHSHSHAHGRCGSEPSALAQQPVLNLKVPVEELIAQPEDQFRAALFNLTRMGTFDLLEEVLTAWVERQFALTDHKNLPHVQAALNALTQATDPTGYSLLHWAAKRVDDVRLVQVYTGQRPLVVPSSSNSKSEDPSAIPKNVYMELQVNFASREATAMTAIHWACTIPQGLPILRELLEAAIKQEEQRRLSQNRNKMSATTNPLEYKDGSGCTPLLLAAQHGQVETVAYLIQRGADVTAVDENRDTATHWAAYKGSLSVLGLLSYYDTQPLQRPDAYGQTPLHLAALRGHTATCKYIIQQITVHNANDVRQANRLVVELLRTQDKNGRTPYELAVHKKKATVAVYLRDAMDRRTLTRQTIVERTKTSVQYVMQNICSTFAWKMWLGVADNGSMDESPRFPYHYVKVSFALNLLYYFAYFLPIGNTSTGVLWDCMILHTIAIGMFVVAWNTFRKTNATDPGRMDRAPVSDVRQWRELYEKTLEVYASDDVDKKKLPTLCHTCHIARPPRCKHDRFSGTCVLLFDHHCPFVGTSVGLWNYKYFFLFVLSMSIYFVCFWILFGLRYSRLDHITIFSMFSGIFLGAHILFAGGMCLYHLQLTSFNVSTNEAINLHKYDYLWEQTPNGGRRIRNPWDKGPVANLMDRMFPSHASYLLPEHQHGLLQSFATLEEANMV